MSPVSKLTISVIVTALALLTVAGQFIQVRQIISGQDRYTANTGELLAGALVGQTFIAEQNNLSAIGVQFATYSNRNNTGTLKFHLRQSPTSGEDLRTASVSAGELKDNQMYRFEFDPIERSAGQGYFFFVTAPEGASGKAITVDISTQDPYFRGSAYIANKLPASLAATEVIARSGKPTLDVTFEVFQTVRLREALVHQTTTFFRRIIGDWPEHKGLYILYGQAIAQVLVVIGIMWLIWSPAWKNNAEKKKKNFFSALLWLLFGLAFLFRYIYARDLPVTYDEGNYLYDGATLLRGHLAGGDGYVKAPLVIGWVALWQWLLGHTVIAGRMSAVFISSFTIFPLYVLARELWGKRAGFMAAALWASAGAAIVSGIYVHTQALALFFGVWGLSALLSALRGHTPHLTFFTEDKVPSGAGWFFFSGVLLGLGVASRKSILALGLVPLLFIAIEGKTIKARGQHIVWVGAGFLSVIILFMLAAYLVYGVVGIQEAIGFNSAEDGLSGSGGADPDQILAYSIRGMTPFFRESLPIIFAVLLGLAVAGEKCLQYGIRKFFSVKGRVKAFVVYTILPKIGWLPAWAVFTWASNFFFSYEGQVFMGWGIPWLWNAFTIIGVATMINWKAVNKVATSARTTVVAKSAQVSVTGDAESEFLTKLQLEKTKGRRLLIAWLVVPIWVGGLAFFYMNWIKFHANYISEFIPPLIILSGYGCLVIWQRFQTTASFGKDYPVVELLRRIGMIIIIMVLSWALFVSNFITHFYEHTGTYDQQAITKAATWASANIPLNERIFTGAAVVAFTSSHHTSLDIAHPRWYAYDFIRNDTARINTFLPSASNMVATFHQTNWVLVDEQTKFSFFNEYDEINNSVKKDFVPVQTIENGSNELTFYQRVK